MKRARTSGWSCGKCGTQRLRTVTTESVRTKDGGRRMTVQSKCPACGQSEEVTAVANDRIISIQYGLP